jgi:N4-(beta-N-acetylglucosaminyl)-L-asparaginase
MINRRQLLAGTAAFAAASAAQTTGSPKNIAISSANGLIATARAMQMLNAGHDTLDAVVAGVNMVELDPNDDSVGYGGLPNEDGVVELDASVMHGPTRRCGAVASIRGIKTPSKVAKLVMEQTDHVMIVGDGALRFAKAWGFQEEDLLTEHSRVAWLMWKQSLQDKQGHNNWTDGLDAPPKKPSASIREMFPQMTHEQLAYAMQRAEHRITGTINCLALNPKGEMSGVTTTSGLSWKIAGRVGDSPLIGAGLFVDQEVGAAGSTGRGEENIRVAGAHTIVENMRHGMPPKEAILDTLKRVSRNYDHDLARLAQFDLHFYALRKDGEYAGGTLWNGQKPDGKWMRNFAVNDGQPQSRLEPCIFLYENAKRAKS